MFKNITKYIRGYSQKIRFFKKLKSNLKETARIYMCSLLGGNLNHGFTKVDTGLIVLF